ncbi:CCA tRNA nucleotidyltransferase [Terrilactibacillus sp. BCM23-1]|uniref:CCA-adding enzyme n=1 Tax=Terrilactibacillus tamarindi TaxID=2599694 RepID=A0A6N8CQW3_9BACI|nr:CCA tRNA nucleotidyltransferase [Terrilactibacillus tamarindi]
MLQFPFPKVLPILNQLNDHGYDAYVVGGAVRNAMLGLPIHDIDITTSATPDIVQNLFQKTVPVGIEHGTVLVIYQGEGYEVTTFRSESEYSDFRHPNHVTFVSSIQEDLKRRDFTMNAMAIDKEGVLIDPYEGKKDCQLKQIRMVGNPLDRIHEDPLRLLRGLRFLSQLDFSLGRHERQAFNETSPLLSKVSIERVSQEMTKLLHGQAVSKALQYLVETNCHKHLLLCENKGEDILSHSKRKLIVLQSDAEHWCAFLMALQIDVQEFCSKWKMSSSLRKAMIKLKSVFQEQAQKPWDVYSLYQSGLEQALAIERLNYVFYSHYSMQDQRIHQLWKKMPIHHRQDVSVTGHDLIKWLNKKSGPWIAHKLEQIEKRILSGQLINRREDIKQWLLQ